ncbi:MAG: FAD-dependent monooxygenase [Tetrasphaera sp.]
MTQVDDAALAAPGGTTAVVRTDVLVVGAGPAGLTAAAFLAKYGVEAITIGKYSSTAPTPRAHVTNQRTVEILRDLGIEDRVEAVSMGDHLMGHNIWSTTFSGTELARIMTWGQGWDRRGDYETASPSRMCNAPQNVLEPVILQAARELGADVRFNSELVAIENLEGKVRATVRSRVDDSEYVIEAKYAIGADGANSVVAELLGFEHEGNPDLGAAFTVWLEADLSKYVAHRPGALFWVAPPGTNVVWAPWTAVVPHNEWMALYLMHEFLPADTSDEAVAEIVRRSIDDDSVQVKIKHIGQWKIRQQVAAEYRLGRVFLAGDAAHRHPPANGLGSNTSIQDTYNLAWKLAYVLQGKADPSLLDTYHDERKPVGRQIIDRAIKSIGELTPLAEALGLAPGQSVEQAMANVDDLFAATPEGEARRTTMLEAARGVDWQLNCHGVELGQRYASPAVVDDGTPWPAYTRDPELYYHPTTHPGAHLPHVWLQRGSEKISTLDLVGQGRFTLLTGVADAAWREAAAEVSRDLGVEVAVVTIGLRAENDDVLGEWIRTREHSDAGAILVRPDRHVAWRAAGAVTDPTGALRDALGAVLGIRTPVTA